MSADVWRVCDIVYEEERLWPGVNWTVLRMYMCGTKSYQFKLTYTPLSTKRRTSIKRRKWASILCHKFQKHLLNSAPCCWNPDLLTIVFFLIMKCNMCKIPLKINSPYHGICFMLWHHMPICWQNCLLKKISIWRHSSLIFLSFQTKHIAIPFKTQQKIIIFHEGNSMHFHRKESSFWASVAL